MFARKLLQNAWIMRLVSIDLNTGKRQLFKEIEPPHRAGVGLGPGPDHTGRQDQDLWLPARRLSDLHVVDGLR